MNKLPSIILAIIALVGGLWGILEAEDRWNQRPACAKLEADLISGMQQLQQQNAIQFLDQRLQYLSNQLRIAMSQNPVDRDLVDYLKREIERTRIELDKLLRKGS